MISTTTCSPATPLSVPPPASIAAFLPADVAVLVVDCRSAMLESPANGNQTRELGQLAAHLSANRTLVCAVNQMDTAVEAGAAEARYNAAVVAVAQQLRRRKEVRRTRAKGQRCGCRGEPGWSAGWEAMEGCRHDEVGFGLIWRGTDGASVGGCRVGPAGLAGCRPVVLGSRCLLHAA